MPPLNRRESFRVAGAWLVAGSLPWWWGCSAESESAAPPFDDESFDDASPAASAEPRGRTPLERTLASARLNGKPVLVFVAPEPPTPSDAFGADVAAALDGGGDPLLFDLALCELVCASPSQLASTAGVAAAPGAVGLLERQGDALRWTAIPWGAWEEPYDSSHPFAHPVERARHNVGALRAAAAGSAELLALRASAAREALGREWVEALEARLAASQVVQPASLDRGAAIVRELHIRDGSPRSPFERDLRASLRAGVGARILSRGPTGARWAQPPSCAGLDVNFLPDDHDGIRFDLQERLAGRAPAPRDSGGHPRAAGSLEPLRALCGMAYGSEGAKRFLVYYVDEP
jgi:hypothetical protein